MPISKANKGKYPPKKEWLSLRDRILKRADNRCEGSPAYPRCKAVNGEEHPETGSKVVLTIAHLDHDPRNNRGDNLRALCQRCHLTHDAPHHARNAAATRRSRKASGDLFP